MRIALINGSPKVYKSASGSLLEDLKIYFAEKDEIVEVQVRSTALSDKVMEELDTADAWVFAFPLYVDGIPGHLLACLAQLEEAQLQNHAIRVYGIVNCGFYEGIQAEFALKILQNWCVKAGYIWGCGIGVGGGGGLAMMPQMEPGQGPKAPIEKAIGILAGQIQQQESKENSYVSVAFPRFLYKMGAQTGWRQMIRANGGTARDLGKRPE
ncbi:MAG: NAD(P)H-dependent oxidoreductase [Lachnospiraceae bacterium]|nr:NAD(P)H-dependent oxidoreductase [Lachnospiraceae bacterium]